MTLRAWFEWLDAFPSSIAFRESIYGYPIVLTSHVVSMALFAGLVVVMDLRLLGIGYRKTPVTEIQRQLFPWQMAGLVVSSITGMVLFYGQPMRYYGKIFFWTKMVLILCAGANAVWFHRTTYRSVGEWDSNVVAPLGARLAGGISIALWAGVVIFGRLTAYQWLTFD